MTTGTPHPSDLAESGLHPRPLPETVQLTAATLCEWRDAGYRVSVQRKADWLYVLARGNRESAVYKVVGPQFDGGQTGQYKGWRVA